MTANGIRSGLTPLLSRPGSTALAHQMASDATSYPASYICRCWLEDCPDLQSLGKMANICGDARHVFQSPHPLISCQGGDVGRFAIFILPEVIIVTCCRCLGAIGTGAIGCSAGAAAPASAAALWLTAGG